MDVSSMYSMGDPDPNSLENRKRNLIQMLMRKGPQSGLPLFGAGRATGAGSDFPGAAQPNLTFLPWEAMASGRHEQLSLPSQASPSDAMVPGMAPPSGPGAPVPPPTFVPRQLFGDVGGASAADPGAAAAAGGGVSPHGPQINGGQGLFRNGLDDVYNLFRAGMLGRR